MQQTYFINWTNVLHSFIQKWEPKNIGWLLLAHIVYTAYFPVTTHTLLRSCNLRLLSSLTVVNSSRACVRVCQPSVAAAIAADGHVSHVNSFACIIQFSSPSIHPPRLHLKAERFGRACRSKIHRLTIYFGSSIEVAQRDACFDCATLRQRASDDSKTISEFIYDRKLCCARGASMYTRIDMQTWRLRLVPINTAAKVERCPMQMWTIEKFLWRARDAMRFLFILLCIRLWIKSYRFESFSFAALSIVVRIIRFGHFMRRFVRWYVDF